MLSLIDNSLLQGLGYGLAVLGMMLSFRILRYPDLTADGSFLLGSATYAAVVLGGHAWPLALAAAFCIGVLAGILTSLMHSVFKINRLLTGILTTMIAYSVGFRILEGRPNVSLGASSGVFEYTTQLDLAEWAGNLQIHPGQLLVSVIVVAVVSITLIRLLRSELGLLLRATGSNRGLMAELGHKPAKYQLIGLGIANGIIAISAAIISTRQGFSDVNMGVGVVITLIAALVIGEEFVRVAGFDPARRLGARITSAFIGASLYFLLYLFILRASIRGWIPLEITPTDLKLLSAVVVVAVIAVRSRSSAREEVLPI